MWLELLLQSGFISVCAQMFHLTHAYSICKNLLYVKMHCDTRHQGQCLSTMESSQATTKTTEQAELALSGVAVSN